MHDTLLLTHAQLRTVLRSLVLQFGTHGAARKLGVSASYVSAVMTNPAKPIGETLAKALGYARVAMFRRTSAPVSERS